MIAVLVARYGPHYSQYPFTPKIDTATPDAAYQSVLDLVTQTRLDAYDNQWEAVRTGYEQAVAICQTQLDGRDPLLAACLNNLAQAYTELGQLERAQSFLERAVPLLAAHEEADEASYLRCLGNLIRNLEHCRQFSEAQPYLKAMLACLERTAIDDDDQRILDVRSRIERPTLNESSAAKLRCARLDVEGDGFGQIMNIVMLE